MACNPCKQACYPSSVLTQVFLIHLATQADAALTDPEIKYDTTYV